MNPKQPILCVRLGDNDFCDVVETFVRLIAPRWFGECPPLSRGEILQLFDELAFGIYCALRGFPAKEKEDLLRPYLRDAQVLVGDEVSAFNNWNGDSCIASLQGQEIVYTVA